MELLWEYRYHPDVKQAPAKSSRALSTKMFAAFRDMVKEESFVNKPGCREVPLAARFPNGGRARTEVDLGAEEVFVGGATSYEDRDY